MVSMLTYVRLRKYYENADLENVNREIYALLPLKIRKKDVMRVRNRKGRRNC